MKTINLELSKRLAPYLESVETEYVTDMTKIYTSYEIDIINTKDKNSAMYGKGESYRSFNDRVHPICVSAQKFYDKIYKTLTLEEAIDFLVTLDTSTLVMEINSFGCCIYYKAHKKGITEKTKIEAIEKMLEYLLDNNLLPKN